MFNKQRSVRAHIAHLDQVFARLRANGIMIKGSKVKLGVKELSFLGQIVNKEGYRPDPSKIKAVADLLPPTNVHQLRRVLGLFAYYRKYIPKFAEIAAPLYALTGKNVQNKRDSQRRIVMNPEQHRSFETLKLKLTTEPIFLNFPKWDCPFEVHCDGSKQGVAAVLTQIVDKQEKVLMYASKSLTGAELNYISYEQEALAMVWSIDLFNHYLRGRPFVVRSDCQALEWLKDKRPRGARINKWLLRLQEYDYKVVHRPGIKSANCDGLTRQPLSPAGAFDVDPFETLTSDRAVVSVITRARKKAKLSSPAVGVGTPAVPLDSISDLDLLDEVKLDKSEAEEKQEKESVPLKAVSSSSPPLSTEPEDDVIFTNPFFRRTSNSRPFFACAEEREGWDRETWISEQQTSEFVKRVISSIATQPRTADLHISIEGVWHKKADLSKSTFAKNRIIVPESLRAFVIGQHHNAELHGHQGRRRTTRMISERYYWPGMSKDISRWIRCCSACARRKTARPINAGLTEVTLSNTRNRHPWPSPRHGRRL